MASEPTMTRDDIVQALDDVWGSLATIGATLSDDEWERPSRLAGWSVKDLYAHVLGTEAMLLGRPQPTVDVPDAPHLRNDIARFNEAWIIERRERPGAEVLAEFVEVTGERLAALARMDRAQFDEEAWTPAGHATYGRFMQIRVFDSWMHEQDVRDAVGRPGDLDGVAVEVVLAEIAEALGFVVGKRAGAPSGASVALVITGPHRHRFDVAVTDRARVTTTPALSPTATVATDLSTFAALIGGRVDPDAVLASGSVDLAGDPDLAHAVATNLAFVI